MVETLNCHYFWMEFEQRILKPFWIVYKVHPYIFAIILFGIDEENITMKQKCAQHIFKKINKIEKGITS